jgi:hypothetical protein
MPEISRCGDPMNDVFLSIAVYTLATITILYFLCKAAWHFLALVIEVREIRKKGKHGD